MALQNSKKRWSPTGVQFLVKHSSGTYYARGYRNGKQVWQSLGTTQVSVARARLSEWLQEYRRCATASSAASAGKMTMADVLRLHLTALDENVSIKESTRHYWRQVSSALFKSWPGLGATDVRRISATDCRSWSAKFAKRVSASRYNNTVAVLRHIFEQAVSSGAIFRNPAQDLQRRKVRPKDLSLPSQEKFPLFVRSIRTAGAWCSQACGDLVEFLAYTGCRKGEAALVRWHDVDFGRGELVVRGDPVAGTKNGEIRRVPLIPAARALLERIRELNPSARSEDKILGVRECQHAMDRAAVTVGIARITHHDLRHLFATVCIEAGTDIPTVSRWLGHKDGGVLAMKPYGHLRNEHSQASAAKLQFAPHPNK